MKKVILILILLVLIPSTLAELQTQRLKIYVNDFREKTLEDITSSRDGGIIEDIKAGDVVEIQIRLLNTWNETVKDIDIRATIEDIDDGDNLVEKISKFDLDFEEEITKTLTFNLPVDIRIDNYDLILEISGEVVNFSDPDYTVSFELDVISSEEDKSFSLFEALGNLSSVCAKLAESNIDFDIINKYTTAESDRKVAVESLRVCNNDFNEEKQSLSVCENERDKRIACALIVKEPEKKDNTGLIILGAVGIYLWTRKKKTKDEEEIVTREEDELFKHG